MSAVKWSILVVLGLASGCATPKLVPVPPEDMMRTDLLAFIRDGVTTREEALVRLGTPSAQFEGQRILTYQIRMDESREAHVVWPRRSELYPALTQLDPGIHSLVLVFEADGLLERHSLVGSR